NLHTSRQASICGCEYSYQYDGLDSCLWVSSTTSSLGYSFLNQERYLSPTLCSLPGLSSSIPIEKLLKPDLFPQLLIPACQAFRLKSINWVIVPSRAMIR